MLPRYPIMVASLAGLLGACSLSVEGFEYKPGAGGGGNGGSDPGVGGAAGGAGGSMSGSSSSANTGSEDCFDNEDTDGDGAIDCADTDCEVVAACAQIPAGWTLVNVSQASPADPPATCADGSTGALYFAYPAGAPECTPCDCSGQPVGASCTAPEMTCDYDNNTCSGGDGFIAEAIDNDCIELSFSAAAPVNIPNGVHSAGSCQLTGLAKLHEAGTCTPSGGEVVPAPLWGSAVLVCPGEAPTGGCANGEICLPLASVCIMRAGEEACPVDWPVSTTVYGGGDDGRACSDCTCTVGCVGGEYVLRDEADCGDYDPPVTVNSQNCVAVPNIFDYDDTSLSPKVATPTLLACEGGVGKGKVNPTDAQRICCKQ